MDLNDPAQILLCIGVLIIAACCITVAIQGGVAVPVLLLLAMVLVLAAVPARGQPAPPPLFTMTTMEALCGSAADHLRVLDANGFEPAWSGQAERGGGAFLVINHEGYWMLLLVFPEAPGRACLVAAGERSAYAPSPF